MTEDSPTALVDNTMIQAAKSLLDDKKAQLANAIALKAQKAREVSEAWDKSVAAIAANGDPMLGAETHAAAVRAHEYVSRLVGEYQRAVTEAEEHFRLERIKAHEPLLVRARQLKMQAAAAKEESIKIAKEADDTVQIANALISAAHAAGLRHFHLNEVGRQARSLREEGFFWQTESEGAKAFWGCEVSI